MRPGRGRELIGGQFADDKVRALTEASRVALGVVSVVIPTRVSESGIASVFKPVFPLFSAEALESMTRSGMFALSEPGRLEEVLAAAALEPYADDEIECPIVFDDVDAAERAFMGAGPTQLAIGTSGEAPVAEAVRAAPRADLRHARRGDLERQRLCPGSH